jgi:hypothetical protein
LLLAHSWWFSPGTPASSTIKTDHHDIAEILLKVALNTNNQIKIITINSIQEMPLTLLQLKNIYSYYIGFLCHFQQYFREDQYVGIPFMTESGKVWAVLCIKILTFS